MRTPSSDEPSTFIVRPPDIVGATVAEPPVKRRGRRTLWIGLAVGIVLCLCVAICVAAASTLIYRGITDRVKIERRLETYMEAMRSRDTARAYEMLSDHARQTTTQADLDALTQGTNYAVFAGYQSLKITTTQINSQFNTDPRTRAEVSGTIRYEDGTEGNFSASMEKYGKHWFVYSVRITIPPEKLAP
jgi:hypothetical protein